MPNDSKKLNKSKKKINDEHYTLYQDIADEVSHYKEQLKGKRIICPCDWDESLDEICVYASEEYVTGSDLFSSGVIKTIDAYKTGTKIEKNLRDVKCNFIKFLIAHAEDYGIKSISVSGYNPKTFKGVKFEDVDYSKYDLVITNPPFSQFRAFANLLFENKIKFLIIGPQNAITYKEFFEHIMNNEVWLGYHYHLTGFIEPDGTVIPRNDNLPRSCCWYTNLDVSYRNDKLILTEEYNPEANPKYVNYNAIHVRTTKAIPYDYSGEMGVPITFLQYYNPEQFEIIGYSLNLADRIEKYVEPDAVYTKGGRAFYRKTGEKQYHREFGRISIKNKELQHE